MDNKLLHDPTPLFLRKRYLIFFLAFLGHVNLYTMRVDFSVAIFGLTKNRTIFLDDGGVSYEQDFNWTSKERGMALSTYFYGYIATQFIGGYVSTKISGRLVILAVFGAGILGSAFMTFLTPHLWKLGINYLYALRIIIGFCSGLSYPAINAVYDKWCPPNERSRVASFGISGLYVGTLIGMSLSDFIIAHYKWEWIFYGFGIVATIWVIIWFIVAKESPQFDNWIKESEKKFILESLDHYETGNGKKTPWCAIFTSMPVYSTAIAHFAFSWGYDILFNEIPDYEHDILGFDRRESGGINAIPCIFISILSFPAGYLADWIIFNNILSTSQVRKFFNNISFFGQMIFLLMAGYFTERVHIFTSISLSMGIAAFSMSGFLANTLDIAPQYSSIILGFANSFATLAMIISPVLSDSIITTPTNAEYKAVFYIASGIYLFAIFFYAIYASGKVQPWAKTNQELPSEMELSTDHRRFSTEVSKSIS